MTRLMVFQHVAAEPLGTLNSLIRDRGHRIRFVNFERQPDAAPSIDHYGGLIILGGPMNVDHQAQRPHLRTELKLIDRALALGKPVLGICLGAQLLAHALGANVRKHSEQEIGWYPLETTGPGHADPVTAALAPRAQVFQWHGCTFDLPQGATQLARTDSCEQQAFRYGDNAYGLQFHLEMDQPLIERWLGTPDYASELAAANLGRSADSIRAETTRHLGDMQARANAAFSAFLDLVGRPARRISLPSR